MTFIEKLRQIERVDQLIRLKATGTPEELAHRLSMSENSIYNLINILRSLGADVYYCDQRRSYCYGEYRLSLAIKTIENTESLQAGNFFLYATKILWRVASSLHHVKQTSVRGLPN